jgi:hypothetical protein
MLFKYANKSTRGGDKMNKKGQSVLEYVIILTAVVAVIIIFANGFLRTRVQNSLEHASTEMEDQVNKISF